MTETYLDRIGGLIRDARKHRGLTQTQLADVLGTSQSAVHRIEAGQPKPQSGDGEPHRRGAGLAVDLGRRQRTAAPARPGWRKSHRHDRGAIVEECRSCACSAPACSTAAAQSFAASPRSKRSTGSSRCSPASACAPRGRPTAMILSWYGRQSFRWTRWISRRLAVPAR